MSTISQDRQTKTYRFLEGLIGYFSILVLIILTILAVVNPILLAIILIVYSFLMVLKTSLHGIYTIYTYKALRRWEKVDWEKLFQLFSKDKPAAKNYIQKLSQKYKNALDWEQLLKTDLKNYELLENTKFADIESVIQAPVFAVYNESSDIIVKSLKGIYNSGYRLENIYVFISQEARIGEEFNSKIRHEISQEDWVNTYNISEKNLDIVYNQEHFDLDYENSEFSKIKNKEGKLTIVFTQHPGDLVGEIKGKSSNEDWGGRQISLFVKANKIDPEKVILTSLDADSRVSKNFFRMLAFRYCLSPNKLQAGFQPLPVYSNNYFTANLFPRLVAANTTIWYMIQSSLLDELTFFANYCVPLVVLQKIDFWNREVIAEDSLLYAKCLTKFHGEFLVIPFYGTFEGNAVDGDDYIETLINQYKQLQRWAWGGIEGFPYKFKKFFLEPEGKKTDLRKRVKSTILEFLNHFYWSTSPIIFSVIVFLPQIIGDQKFKESTIQLNLWLFSQYFAWLSFIFLAISTYITFQHTAIRASKTFQTKWYHWLLLILQAAVSPLIFVFWGPPALDVQIRGIFGKYLGYWVTPKK